MRNLILWLIAMVFCFISFSGHSRGLSQKLKEDAIYIMEALKKGDIIAYHEKWSRLSYKDKKKILKFVNEDGDNILHFWVRLERHEVLKSPSSNYTTTPRNILLSEIYRIKNLDPWQYARLLTQKNKQGVSPAQEAAASLDQVLESNENWRSRLFLHLSEQTVSKLLDLGASVPLENRGLAYGSLKSAFKHDWWTWRIPFEAFITGAVTIMGGVIVGSGDIPLSTVLVRGAVGACASPFLRFPRLNRARRSVSAPTKISFMRIL